MNAIVLGKATARVAASMGIPCDLLAEVIGLTCDDAVRVAMVELGITPTTQTGARAALLVQIFEALGRVIQGSEKQRVAWLNTPCEALRSTPMMLMATPEGMARTLAYLSDTATHG